MTDNQTVCIPAKLDADDFLRFAIFDTFRLKKRWKAPLAFALIMSAFAAACFALRGRREQAALLGTVLLCIGLILPLVWLLFYPFSVRREARGRGLSKSVSQYETRLDASGITVTRGKETASFRWADLHMAWRVPGCIYLYAAPNRAFLLPEDENADHAWELVCAHLPAQKRQDLRPGISSDG